MNFIQYSIAHLRQGTRTPERGGVSSNLVCNLHHFRDEPRNKKAAHFTQEESRGLGGSQGTDAYERSIGSDALIRNNHYSEDLCNKKAIQFAQGRSPGEDGSQGTDAYGRSIGSDALNFNGHQCHEVCGRVSLVKGEGNTIPRKGRHKLTPPFGGRHDLH